MFVKLAEYMKPSKVLARPHKGIVVDNEDPEKLGRIKCTVNKLFEGEPESLPWIFSKHLDPNKLDIPELGQELIIEFPYDDIYAPFYTGFWNNTPLINPKFDINYPNTFGLDKGGLSIIHNKETKQTDIIHPNGSTLNAVEDGTLTLAIAGDLILTVAGDYTITSDGEIVFTPTGDFKVVTDAAFDVAAAGGVSITTDADVAISGDGGVEITSTASAKFAGTAITEVGDSGSVTKVDGTAILLAGGGLPVALLTSQTIGVGNLGSPVISNIIQGSSKVLAPV